MRLGTPYSEQNEIVAASPDIKIQLGESGYFSTPSPDLDPNLFNGTKIKPEVRSHILTMLYSYWAKKYHRPKLWSTAWLAGSGISYQWSAARGNGDLDVLIGIDWPRFYEHNPSFQGSPAEDVSAYIDSDLKTNLWPRTASTLFGTTPYELTYYVNATATDIRTIHPYAAYNLSANQWTIAPPKLENYRPETYFPRPFWDSAQQIHSQAKDIVARYEHYKNNLRGDGSPQDVNTGTALASTIREGSDLFSQIHSGRKLAFGPGGRGYGDYNNFLWQYSKQHGIIDALHSLASERAQIEQTHDTALYGESIDNAHTVLTKNSLRNL